MANQFPVNLVLGDRPVLVVGGGRIALRKTGQLLACGANVTVVSPEFTDGFDGLPVRRVQREFATADLDGTWLVITATGIRDVDQAIFDAANERRIWVNSADDPERCTFTLPAVVRRGDLMVTTSTAGASPALASFLRARLDECLADGWADAARELAEIRRAYHRDGVSTETVDWQPILRDVLGRLGLDAFRHAPAGAAR